MPLRPFTQAELDDLIRKGYDMSSYGGEAVMDDTPPDTGATALGAGLRSAGASAIPTAAGGLGLAGGTALGVALAPETGGLSLLIPAVMGLGGAIGASKLASKGQEALMSDKLKQQLGEEAQRFPKATLAGSLATLPLGGFYPSPTTLGRAGGGLVKLGMQGLGNEAALLNAAERTALVNTGAGAALGAAQGVALPALEGHDVNLKDVLLNTAIGATFNKPNKIGRVLGFHEPVLPTVQRPELMQGMQRAEMQRLIEQQALAEAAKKAETPEVKIPRGKKETAPAVVPGKTEITINNKPVTPEQLEELATPPADKKAQALANLETMEKLGTLNDYQKEQLAKLRKGGKKSEQEEGLQSPLAQEVQQKLDELGLSAKPSAEYIAEMREFLRQRNIHLTEAEFSDLISRKVPKGMASEKDRTAYITSKATVDTPVHEAKHLSDLFRAFETGDKQAQALLTKLLAKSEPGRQKYNELTREHNQKNPDKQMREMDPEEFAVSEQGLEFIKQQFNLAEEGGFRRWWNDVKSLAKTKWGKDASIEDIRRAINYRFVNETGLGKVGERGPLGAVGGKTPVTAQAPAAPTEPAKKEEGFIGPPEMVGPKLPPEVERILTRKGYAEKWGIPLEKMPRTPKEQMQDEILEKYGSKLPRSYQEPGFSQEGEGLKVNPDWRQDQREELQSLYHPKLGEIRQPQQTAPVNKEQAAKDFQQMREAAKSEGGEGIQFDPQYEERGEGVPADYLERLKKSGMLQKLQQPESERMFQQTPEQQTETLRRWNEMQNKITQLREDIRKLQQGVRDKRSEEGEGLKAPSEDLRNYQELVGKLRTTQPGSPEFNDTWQQLESLKNRFGGKPPKESVEGEGLRSQQTETPEFKKWFGESKVVDKDGKPLVVYHTAPANIIGESGFDESGNWFAKWKPLDYSGGLHGHFGTKNQAEQHWHGSELSSNKEAGGQTIPVYLSIKNPKRVDDTKTYWQKEIKQAKEEGYDGIVYKNKFEPDDYVNDIITNWDKYKQESLEAEKAGKSADDISEGALMTRFYTKSQYWQAQRNSAIEAGVMADSYLPFYPEQIKSAIGNKGTFDPNNPDIRMSQEGEGLSDKQFKQLDEQGKEGVTPNPYSKDELWLGKMMQEGLGQRYINSGKLHSGDPEALAFFNSRLQSQQGEGLSAADPSLKGFLPSLESTFDRVERVSSPLAQAGRNWQARRDQEIGKMLVTWDDLRHMKSSVVNSMIVKADKAFREGGKPSFTPQEAEAHQVWESYFGGNAQRRQEMGMKISGREAGRNPYYVPHMLNESTIDLFTNKSTSPEAAYAKKLWIDHVMKENPRLDPTEVKENINAYISAMGSPGSHYSSINFGALRKAQGYGLPEGLREKNWQNILTRYGRRASVDMALFQEMESKPEIRKALMLGDPNTGKVEKTDTQYHTSKEVQNMMRWVTGGVNEQHNAHPFLSGWSRFVNNSLLGPATGLRDTASIPVFALPYINKFSDLGAAVKGIINLRENSRAALETAARQPNIDKVQFNEIMEGPNTFLKMLSKAATIMRKGQGREALENFNRNLTFSIGKELARNNVLGAQGGHAGSKKWLERFGTLVDGDVTKMSGEELNGALNQMAKNFTDANQGTYGGAGLPIWTQEGQLAPFLALQKWSIEKSNTIWKDVVKPAYTGENYVPLLTYTLGSVLTGAGIQELNKLLSGKRSQDPSVAEALDKGDAKAITSQLATLMQLASFGGIVGDSLKLVSDAAKGKQPRNPLSFPAYSNTLEGVERISQAVQAVKEGDDPVEVLSQLSLDLMSMNIQTARLARSNINKEETDRANKFRDMRVNAELEGKPRSSIPSDANPYLNMDAKEFKRSSDISKSATQLPSLIQRRIESAKGNPFELSRQLRSLKGNSFQSMPDMQTDPLAFQQYYDFLTRTQGAPASQERLADYMKQSLINELKSSLIPSL